MSSHSPIALYVFNTGESTGGFRGTEGNTGADPSFKKRGGSNIFDVAKYIGVLEVGCCMHINSPSFVQRVRHFGDYNPCHLKVTSRTKWSIFLVIKC